jgi:hypothetical protein
LGTTKQPNAPLLYLKVAASCGAAIV